MKVKKLIEILKKYPEEYEVEVDSDANILIIDSASDLRVLSVYIEL